MFTDYILSKHSSHIDSPETESLKEILKLMTLNIAHGRGTFGHQLYLSKSRIQKNLSEICEFILNHQPDVVALQEVDGLSFWNGKFDHAKYIAKKGCFFQSLLGEHMDGFRLKYGTSLLSQLPLKDPVSVGFLNSRPLPRKGFVVAKTHWPGRKNFEFDVVSLHLDFLRSRKRQKEVDQILEILRSRNRPAIVMGDFNCEWNSPYSALRELASKLNFQCFQPESEELATFPFRSKRWDWILISSDFEYVSYETHQSKLSDHLPVIAEVRLKDNL